MSENEKRHKKYLKFGTKRRLDDEKKKRFGMAQQRYFQFYHVEDYNI